MRTSPPQRVAMYARYSSDNQRSESIDAQIRAMTKYCEQNKLQVVEKYIDEAKSGTSSDKRPEFLQMIADSSKHIFDIVLVHKLDRFSRNRYDSAIYKNELKKNGVKVYSVLENLDSSPESVILEALLEGMSEYYSKNLAREVMKGLKENALQCKHTGGIPPLGYDVSPDGHLVINEAEAEAVRLIFDRYSQGISYDTIISELNRKGYLTKQGQPFQRNSLYSILTNEKYHGVYVYNKSSSKSPMGTRNTHSYKDNDEIIRIPDGCPRIVSEETFLKVSNIIAENREAPARNRPKERYFLGSFIRCGYCGRAMYGNRRYSGRNKNLYVTYRCPTHKDRCSNKEINRGYIEAYVLSLIKSFFGKKSVVKKMMDRINRYIHKNMENINTQIATSTDELVELNQRIDNVMSMITGGMSYDEIYETMDKLQAEKSAVVSRMEKLNAKISHVYDDKDIDEIISQCKMCINSPSSVDGRLFLHRILKSVLVFRDHVEISLKTGLGVNDEFDTSLTVDRKEIYALSS